MSVHTIWLWPASSQRTKDSACVVKLCAQMLFFCEYVRRTTRDVVTCAAWRANPVFTTCCEIITNPAARHFHGRLKTSLLTLYTHLRGLSYVHWSDVGILEKEFLVCLHEQPLLHPSFPFSNTRCLVLIKRKVNQCIRDKYYPRWPTQCSNKTFV